MPTAPTTQAKCCCFTGRRLSLQVMAAGTLNRYDANDVVTSSDKFTIDLQEVALKLPMSTRDRIRLQTRGYRSGKGMIADDASTVDKSQFRTVVESKPNRWVQPSAGWLGCMTVWNVESPASDRRSNRRFGQFTYNRVPEMTIGAS